jgi:hypothetical protein
MGNAFFLRRLVAVPAFLALTGCSARLLGGAVQDPGAEPHGVRYRTTVPHEVRVFFFDEGVTKVQGVAVMPLPPPDSVREINYEGALVRSYKFELTLRPDSTLADVSLTAQSDSKVAASGAALDESVKAVRERLAERDPDVRRKKQLDKENDLLEAQKKNRELKQQLGE